MSRIARSLAAWFAIWRPMLAGPFVDHPEIGSDDEPDDLMAVADAVQDELAGEADAFNAALDHVIAADAARYGRGWMA